MRKFRLYRTEDVSGVSGTGYVAEGCEFSNGKVAVTWLSTYPTVTVHESISSVEAIHCHGGKTAIEWVDIYPARLKVGVETDYSPVPGRPVATIYGIWMRPFRFKPIEWLLNRGK